MAHAGLKTIEVGRPQAPARGQEIAPASVRARAARSRRGMTLVELAFAMTILVIGVLGFAEALIASIQAQVHQRESDLALQGARRTLESIQAVTFASAFSRYNGTTADDPAGNASPGADFAVRGLRARADDADGLPGEVIFPIAAGAASVLREDTGDAALDMPRDLSGDGGVDAANHASNYRLLPVVVRVEWRGVRGNQRLELKTLLGALK